jgi:hypothetical protein
MPDRADASSPVPWWWLRGLLWTVAAVLSGPVAVSGLLCVGFLVLAWPGLRTASEKIPAAFVVMVVFSGAAAIVLGAAYLPVLLAWSRWGRRLGRWERAWGPLCVALAVLAAPAAATVMVVYGRMELPFGARGAELARMGGAVFVGTWLGLLLPRLVLPALRPGAFAHDPADS